ncbi:MAG TPA: hypothetical protein VNT81_20345 [Vicinamibacterales bacterium]|nr:hypothetical protein [Vicinamibacterales bacterium]
MRWIPFRSLAVIVALVACVNSPQAEPHQQAPAAAEIAELWQEPTDLLQRDLFLGPAANALTPPADDGTFQFVAFKTSGTNPGYDVRDASGRLWSVKLGIEAQSEVTTSRILWAMGFHQPPLYFVRRFNLSGTDGGIKETARFRTDLDPWRPAGEWSWTDNPFVNTPEYRGLIVAQLVLNNWDLKTPNNRIYEATDGSTKPRRHFMVRDVGSSLGHSRQFWLFATLGTRGLQGSKNDVDGFEAQGFITKVAGDDVEFDYRGINGALVDRVTVKDVIWACTLLDRIPDGHWQAAFKAGAYPQDHADRYIRKIKEKIAQGLALRQPPTR